MNAALDGDDAPIPESTVNTSMKIDGDGRLIVQRFHDVEPLLDHLAELRATTNGKSQSGEMYHVGDLDPVVVEDYMKQAGITFHEFLTDDVHIKRILMNPDYSKFRVWQGRF